MPFDVATIRSPTNIFTAMNTTDLVGRSRNTPYTGTTLPGRVVATFLRGVPTVLDGKVLK